MALDQLGGVDAGEGLEVVDVLGVLGEELVFAL